VGVTPAGFCPELCYAVAALAAKGVAITLPDFYYNWAGLIREEDLDEVGASLAPLVTERSGPCAMILYKNIVLPDGRLSACACRDAMGVLIIGDLTKQRLKSIYAMSNQAYLQLIRSQEEGDHGPLCGRCNMFRSVYKPHSTYQKHSKPILTLDRFHELLTERAC
jgi:hypothetical protein